MDSSSAFDALDDEIAELEDACASCRRAIVVSRAAIAAGGLTLVGSLPFPALREATVAFAALAAMIGGTVWAGASRTSREELAGRLAAAEARRAALFDEVAARNGWRDITPTVH